MEQANTIYRTCAACGEKFPAAQSNCTSCGANQRVARRRAEQADEGAFQPERRALDKGVVGGLALIAIAAVWFVGGYAAGYIFYYPPILALIGVFGVVKGIATGNLAGRRGRRG